MNAVYVLMHRFVGAESPSTEWKFEIMPKAQAYARRDYLRNQGSYEAVVLRGE